MLVANPPALIAKMARGVAAHSAFAVHTEAIPCATWGCCTRSSVYAQRAGGIMELEKDVDDPERSPIFSDYPEFLRDRVARDFVCDSLRMLVIGVTTAHELDQLMDLDIEVQRRGRHEPVDALNAMAEALPGLGIVAAVLGVVITMQAIGGAPEAVGQKVAAALVGTFLGILLCYGVVGPVASRMESLGEAQAQFLQVLRIAMSPLPAAHRPLLAVEYARRSIPPRTAALVSSTWRPPSSATP